MVVTVNRYSYSKIKNFKECPYCFYRHYIEKDTEESTHGTSEFGSFAHEILEKYAKNELEEYELLPYYLEHYKEKVQSTMVLKLADNFSRNFSELYFESGKKYFENFQGFGDLDVLEAEYEFDEVVDDKFLLTGKVDLICRNTDGDLVIIDHKSKSKFKTKAERNEYSKQLYIYSFAVNRKYGEFPKYLKFNMFRNENPWVEFEFDENKYKETMQWVSDEVEEIENCTEFNPITTGFYHNNFCPYILKCTYKR